MSKKTTTLSPVNFSAEQLDYLRTAEKVIEECQYANNGLAETVAGQLWYISKNGLYAEDGFKSMSEYAKEKFGISAGTTSDSVNTFERFRDYTLENKQIVYTNIYTGDLLIDEKWRDYKFSTLMQMKHLTDKQIELLGIDCHMSRTEVKARIAELSTVEQKRDNTAKLMNQLYALIGSLEVYETKETIAEYINSIVPGYEKSSSKYNFTDEELEMTVKYLKRYLDGHLAAKELGRTGQDAMNVVTTFCNDDKVELTYDEEKGAYLDFHVYNTEEAESSDSDVEEEVKEPIQIVNAPDTIPVIDVTYDQLFYRGKRRAKKEIMEEIWALLEQKYFTGEAEIHFHQKTEK